jgi:hypothetical protein
LFFDPDEVPDGGHMMDQVISGKRKDGTAAIPAVKFLDFDSKFIESAYG